MPLLCLGTVQFGIPYGITNTVGKVPESQVRELLSEAAEAGLTMLDTAQAYGDAEAVLGRTLSNKHELKLISKLPAQKQDAFIASDRFTWDAAFEDSCRRLGQDSLDSFLVHNAADFHKPGSSYLHSWLRSLREDGRVRRIGVSIYESSDLQRIPSDLLDLVQLPLSLYDQRLLADGTISALRDRGCAIHARSIYLQGLLLRQARDWPSWINPSARKHHALLEQLASERKCSLLDLAVGFAGCQQDLEAVVVGICSQLELHQLLTAWKRSSPWKNEEWLRWGLDAPTVIDPRCWPSSNK